MKLRWAEPVGPGPLRTRIRSRILLTLTSNHVELPPPRQCLLFSLHMAFQWLRTFGHLIAQFLETVDRIPDRPNPTDPCGPPWLDRGLANRSWFTPRCIFIFTVGVLALVLVTIFLYFYCDNTIPCK